MKKLITLLIALIICQSMHAQIDFSTYKYDGAYIFDDDFKVLKSELFTTYKSQFDLNTDDAMVLMQEGEQLIDSPDTIKRPYIFSQYQQKYKGYIVESKVMNVMSMCGVVQVVNGSLLVGLNIDDGDLITANTALSTAKDYLGAIAYPWETWMEDSLKIEMDDTGATYYPTGELVIAKKYGLEYEDVIGNYDLCWKFQIPYVTEVIYIDTNTSDTTIDTIIHTILVYVDANTDEVISAFDPSNSYSHHSASQLTFYYSSRTNEMITGRCNTCTNYELQNTKVITRRIDDGTTKKIKDNDNFWGEIDTRSAAQAHWAVGIAIEYWNNRLGINDNNKVYIQTESSLARDNNWLAAFSPINTNGVVAVDDRIIVEPDRFDYTTNPPTRISVATFDIMAHEYTHAKNYRHSKVGINEHSQTEAQAINEGIADVFAMLTERWKWGYPDWTLGEVLGYQYERNFYDPTVDFINSSKSYNDANWSSGGSHSRGGVVRKWFTQLSQGDAHWPVPWSGIGIDKAEIFTRDLFIWNLWQNVTFADMRKQSLILAEQYWGKCSPEWKAVERAWYDVGRGTLSLCNRNFNPNAPTPVVQPPIGSYQKMAVIIKPTIPATSYDEIDYDWLIPSHWTVVYNGDNSGFWISDADDDLSSQIITVIVSYVPEGEATTYYDTLTFPIHFSDECEGESKPGRPTGFGNKMAAKNVSDIKVYPNPTDKHLIIEGAANGTVVQLLNVMGQEVYKGIANQQMTTVNTSQLVPGVYILNLTDIKGNKDTRRIVKQ